jgi:hypothetical protein
MVVGPFRQFMKAIALPMVLLMLTATLSGCTGGDPDGGDGTDGIDMETLNQMIEDNLEDFLNNTSVTVNQDFHYYNNTTNEIDNTDNSVSNINGSGVGSASTMQMFTVSWSLENFVDDPGDWMLTNDYSQGSSNGENDSGGNGSGSGSGGDNTLLFARSYNGYVIEFRLTCEEYLNYYSYDEDDWRQYLVDNYGYSSDEIDDTANWIKQQIEYAGAYYNIDAFQQCIYNVNYMIENRVILYEIDLEVGQAMRFLVNGPYVTVDINCDDGYGTGLGNGTSTVYIGGQANCTITGSTALIWRMENLGPITDENGETVVINDKEWIEYGAIPYHQVSPENFAVYFTMYNVEVYDLDSE